MSAMQAEVYQAFRAIDVPEDKALKAAPALAAALSKRDAETESAFEDRDGKIGQIRTDIGAIRFERAALRDGMAGKADLEAVKPELATLRTTSAGKAERDAARAEIKRDIAGVKGDVALLKWMMGFSLAFNVAISFKPFSPSSAFAGGEALRLRRAGTSSPVRERRPAVGLRRGADATTATARAGRSRRSTRG